MSDYVKYEVRVYPSGNKIWYLNDMIHREDGPAVESTTNRYKKWYLNDKLHREDGPAIESRYGYKSWYLEGVNYTKSGHKAEMKRRNNNCNGKVVTIEGKQYELAEIK
jgi:hypothetical protein